MYYSIYPSMYAMKLDDYSDSGRATITGTFNPDDCGGSSFIEYTDY